MAKAKTKTAPQKTATRVISKQSGIADIIEGVQQALLFESNSLHYKGTENGFFENIKKAFSTLKTEEDLEQARKSIYDVHYKMPNGQSKMLGRKGEGTTSKEANREPAPKTLSNVFSICAQAVRPCITNKEGEETQFGYKEWLPENGLHGFDSINDEENPELGLKRILREKKNDPDRNLRNKANAIRKAWLENEVKTNKEKSKLSDKAYFEYVTKTYKS